MAPPPSVPESWQQVTAKSAGETGGGGAQTLGEGGKNGLLQTALASVSFYLKSQRVRETDSTYIGKREIHSVLSPTQRMTIG